MFLVHLIEYQLQDWLQPKLNYLKKIKDSNKLNCFITVSDEKAIDAADAGKLVDHAEVKAKWEAKRGTQVD